MRASKDLITHGLCVLMDAARRRFGDTVKIELSGDGGVKLTADDLVGHEFAPRTIQELVYEVVEKVTKFDKAEDIKSILHEYPRKRDIEAARKATLAAMRDEEIPVHAGDRVLYLKTAVRLFAHYCKLHKKNPEYIPYPATWMNRKSYLNATAVVLRLMKELKEGKQPVIKKSEFPQSWNQNP